MHEIPQMVLARAQASEPIFTAAEVAAWPDGLLDLLVTEGILIASTNAAAVVCDACGHDHVERVEYVSSPVGSGLRAYISCPENGRVGVPLDRLRQWAINRPLLVSVGLLGSAAAGDKGDKVARRPKDRQKDERPKRSWTQSELDDAIRDYKVQRAATYSNLAAGVDRGQPGAKKDAQRLFGRNAIARRLGVKARAMVTKSPEWQAIANELKLPRTSGRRTTKQGHRIGMEIALEEQSISVNESIADQVVRRETIQLIEASMPAAEAEATIEKLVRGEISDDQARQLVVLHADQRQDNRTRRVGRSR